MTEQKVIQTIAEHFTVAPETLSLSTDLVLDLHADSLDLVELILAFEDGFELSIPDEVALSVKTIGDIVQYLDKNA